MARPRREWVSQDTGSYHIISHIADRANFLNDEEKEYFLELLERFASGFFVQIHSYAIMGSHFHLLVTGMEREAEKASKEELLARYKQIHPKKAEPPNGSYQSNGKILPDEDEGIERLRQRLGSISRFVQELKQTFSRWYNKKRNRKGYLWNDRFKGIIVAKGEPQLICSSYIDLNPVRAGIVQQPEDYRWCSLGLRVRAPGRAGKLLTWFSLSPDDYWSHPGLIDGFKSITGDPFNWYREFVYRSGGIPREGAASIPPEIVASVSAYHGKLGLGERLRYRVRNISEGIAMGNYDFIRGLQEKLQRKFLRPRSFLSGNFLFTTRVLRKS